MSTEKAAVVHSSTKDLKRTLGRKELMGIAIGQIIGAGIMSMVGVAIAMTGRSANLAFMLSAVFTMCSFSLPSSSHHAFVCVAAPTHRQAFLLGRECLGTLQL